MGRLLDTFKKIDDGRKRCIHSLNTMNVPTSEDATLGEIAIKIKERSGEINIAKEQHMWERPDEWIDTKELLLNAPELDGYTAFAIHLLHDNRPNISLSLANPSTNYTSFYDAFYMSDGTFITNPGSGTTTIQHTWDVSKDIKTNLGYNLRYIIEYANNAKLNSYANGTATGYFSNNTQYGIGISLLETVYNSDAMRKDSNISLPNRSSSDNVSNILRLHIIGEKTVAFGGTYNYVLREIQVDKTGELKWNLWSADDSSSHQLNRKIIIPNATTIDIGVGNSGRYLQGMYLYVPNVTKIVRRNYSYGDIKSAYIYAPRLTEVGPGIAIECNYDTMKYIPKLSNTSCIKSSFIGYLNEVIYFHKENDMTIDTSKIGSAKYAWFNEQVTNITGVKLGSYVYINDVYFPNLQSFAPADFFVDTSYAARTRSFVIGDGFKSSINLSSMVKLPTITVLDILHKLADVTNEEQTYTLTLGTKLLSLLSSEEKAIATNKGWVLE